MKRNVQFTVISSRRVPLRGARNDGLVDQAPQKARLGIIHGPKVFWCWIKPKCSQPEMRSCSSSNNGESGVNLLDPKGLKIPGGKPNRQLLTLDSKVLVHHYCLGNPIALHRIHILHSHCIPNLALGPIRNSRCWSKT
jgi:hypothetical protein